MKRLAGLLFLIFAFNIVAEMSGGDCHEFCSSDRQEIQETDAKFFAAASIHEKLPTHKKDVHICHFGHCSHITLVTAQTVPVRSLDPILWIADIKNPIWRNLAPPLKPPIA